jgi:hypothetical protein
MHYERMNWKSLPRELEDGLLEYAKEAPPINPNLTIRSIFSTIVVPTKVEEWLRDELPISDRHTIVIQRLCCPLIGIHKDSIRDYAYNYVLSDDNATTHFYDDDQVLIDSVQYEKSVWYYHNTDVFHSVDGITDCFRCAISIFETIPAKLGDDYALNNAAPEFLKWSERNAR